MQRALADAAEPDIAARRAGSDLDRELFGAVFLTPRARPEMESLKLTAPRAAASFGLPPSATHIGYGRPISDPLHWSSTQGRPIRAATTLASSTVSAIAEAATVSPQALRKARCHTALPKVALGVSGGSALLGLRAPKKMALCRSGRRPE